jgi:hypothetical protein
MFTSKGEKEEPNKDEGTSRTKTNQVAVLYRPEEAPTNIV